MPAIAAGRGGGAPGGARQGAAAGSRTGGAARPARSPAEAALNLSRADRPRLRARSSATSASAPAEVVYFVPILFVLVFFLRSLADFLSGYAFQHIGLGITTDIRNDLYRQHPRPVEPLPRRPPLGRAGGARGQRRGADAERRLEPAARPLPAVGHPASCCWPSCSRPTSSWR